MKKIKKKQQNKGRKNMEKLNKHNKYHKFLKKKYYHIIYNYNIIMSISSTGLYGSATLVL